MRPWGLPPRYGVYPIGVLERSEVPGHLKLTYITLCALAWRTKGETVLQSMAQLAELFSVIEGKALTERGMRKRIGDLAKAGLVKRVSVGGRWLTRLLLSDEALSLSTGTGGATLALQSATSIVTADDGVQVPIHQHQFFECGTGGATLEEVGPVRRELWALGIDEPTATELAEMGHVTVEYLEAWAGYCGWQRAGGSQLSTGWLILQIRAGRPAPLVGIRA